MAEVGELRKTIVIDAIPEVVFKALTDEKELIQWMPQEARIDARVGGEFEFKYRWAARALESVVRGKILEFIPNKRISYTWDAQTTGGSPRITSAVVTWVLDSMPDGKTSVTLIHSGVSKEFRQDAESGWTHYLSQLENYTKRK